MGKIFQSSRAFRKAIQKAGSMISDKDRMNRLLERTQVKMGSMDGVRSEMRSFFDKIRTFIRMIRSYINGSYRQVPLRTLVLILAGLIYFITPFDFLPDFIPGLGMIDDATIVLSIFKSISNDVRAFENFENEIPGITKRNREEDYEV